MTFYHEGDCGDIISSLPVVRALGGGDYRIGTNAGAARETMFGTRFESIKPLLLAQPYIHSVEWTFDKRGIDVDFPRFREKYQLHDNLALAHARYAGVEITLEPWLQVPSDAPRRPVIARSPRYHHSCFPWRRLLKKHPKAVFVGLFTEWNAFCENYGEISYHASPDLLDLAQVIAAADPLICNQSLPWWLGVGLGVSVIQETFLSDMNSIIERPNCHYSRTMEEINAL